MNLDTLLEKHGLPTWGSDEVKKERAMRNNLLAADKLPVAPTMEKKVELPAPKVDEFVAAKPFPEAAIIPIESRSQPIPAILRDRQMTQPEVEAFIKQNKRGRPAKVK